MYLFAVTWQIGVGGRLKYMNESMAENNAGGGRVKSEGLSGNHILKRSPGHSVATSLPL